MTYFTLLKIVIVLISSVWLLLIALNARLFHSSSKLPAAPPPSTMYMQNTLFANIKRIIFYLMKLATIGHMA